MYTLKIIDVLRHPLTLILIKNVTDTINLSFKNI